MMGQESWNNTGKSISIRKKAISAEGYHTQSIKFPQHLKDTGTNIDKVVDGGGRDGERTFSLIQNDNVSFLGAQKEQLLQGI